MIFSLQKKKKLFVLLRNDYILVNFSKLIWIWVGGVLSRGLKRNLKGSWLSGFGGIFLSLRLEMIDSHITSICGFILRCKTAYQHIWYMWLRNLAGCIRYNITWILIWFQVGVAPANASITASNAARSYSSDIRKITLIPGDGIGPEISAAVQQIFKAANVPIDWEEVDVTPVRVSEYNSFLYFFLYNLNPKRLCFALNVRWT